MTARLARTDDLPRLHEMARAYEAEVTATMPFLRVQRDRLDEQFALYLQTADPTFFVTENHRGEVVGALVASIQGFRFQSGLWTNVEVILVAQENRGTRAAAELLACFVEWSDNLGALMMAGGNANMLYTEQTASLYRKFGFVETGKAMMKFRGS